MTSKDIYIQASRATIVIHALWTILVFGGGVFVLFYPGYAPYQIAVMSFTIIMWLPFGGQCSLTLFARHFEKKAGIYTGDDRPFMEKYLSKLCKTPVSRTLVIALTTAFYIASYIISILALRS